LLVAFIAGDFIARRLHCSWPSSLLAGHGLFEGRLQSKPDAMEFGAE
jgi:hypothetical protein